MVAWSDDIDFIELLEYRQEQKLWKWMRLLMDYAQSEKRRWLLTEPGEMPTLQE